jgi:hypothetical protein
MKIVNQTPDKQLPDHLYEDFVLHLQNGTYKPYNIRLALSRLDRLKDFGLIIPKNFLINISAAYTTQDIDYTEWAEEDRKIYQHWDAIFVRKA